MTKCTADNARFGARAAVTPLKVLCGYERKYPAERLVSAAASPSRRPLGASGRKRHREYRAENSVCLERVVY